MKAGKPFVTRSNVGRPYLLSVDADIPTGCIVDVVVEGMLPGRKPGQKTFRNPLRQPLPFVSPPAVGIVALDGPPDSLACPFLVGIEIEGDYQKQTWLAEQVAPPPPPDGNFSPVAVVHPKQGAPYLTRISPMMKRVYASDVARPWIIAVEGSAPHGSQLIVTMIATEPDGSAWQQRYNGPCREQLLSTTFLSFQFGIEMHASPDGHFAPSLSGIAIEGDGRRLLRTAADFMDEGESATSNMQLFHFQDDESMLILKPELPPFAGQPPSVLARLQELHEQGALEPAAEEDDEAL